MIKALKLSNSTTTWQYAVTEQKIAKNRKKTKVGINCE